MKNEILNKCQCFKWTQLTLQYTRNLRWVAKPMSFKMSHFIECDIKCTLCTVFERHYLKCAGKTF